MSLNIERSFADRPMGMQDGYPDFAKRRRQVESILVDYFDHAGNELVSSGAFEYVDTLLRARSSEAQREWVQLFDPTGNTIALRPEMTPSIARMAAPLVKADKGPIQWCYAERIYRRTNDPASLSWASGRAAESTQVGVEWIGKAGVDVDAEILAVTHAATRALGLRETQVVVSHARLVPAFLRACGIEETAVRQLLDCLIQGDYVAFRQGIPSHLKVDVLETLQSLSPFQPEMIENALSDLAIQTSSATEALHSAWKHLCELADVLQSRQLTHAISFDMTLYRDISYYTGIVFEVFAPGVGAPIAQGGRYDELLEQFGAQAPAVGMAFEVERVLAVHQQMQLDIDAGKEA